MCIRAWTSPDATLLISPLSKWLHSVESRPCFLCIGVNFWEQKSVECDFRPRLTVLCFSHPFRWWSLAWGRRESSKREILELSAGSRLNILFTQIRGSLCLKVQLMTLGEQHRGGLSNTSDLCILMLRSWGLIKWYFRDNNLSGNFGSSWLVDTLHHVAVQQRLCLCCFSIPWGTKCKIPETPAMTALFFQR